jgi:hypothetical protein
MVLPCWLVTALMVSCLHWLHAVVTRIRRRVPVELPVAA